MHHYHCNAPYISNFGHKIWLLQLVVEPGMSPRGGKDCQNTARNCFVAFFLLLTITKSRKKLRKLSEK